MKIKGLYLRYLFHHNYIRSLGGSVSISPKSHLRDVKAYIYNGGSLTIGENCRIENCIISISGGKVELSENSIVIGKSHEPVQINVEDGKISISHHVKVCCKRVWVRFGGELSIGEYTNINDGSEIRCDERVTIGAFNQISYNVRIWDTNTHSIFPIQNIGNCA